MPWTHAFVLLLFWGSPPPCSPADLDRFPPCIHTEQAYPSEADGGACGYWITGCPAIDPRMAWLRAQRHMHPRNWIEWDEQLAEQEHIEDAWRTLWYARVYRKRECLSPQECADALQRLRAMIGEEAYSQGRMPSPVPLHRYHAIDR